MAVVEQALEGSMAEPVEADAANESDDWARERRRLLRDIAAGRPADEVVDELARLLERQEALLRRREEELHAVTAHVPHLISRFDRELRHLFVNATAAALVGRSQEECLGRRLGELGVPDFVAGPWEEHLGQVFDSGQGVTFTSGGEDEPDSHVLHVQLVPEHGADGRVATVLSVAQDVTAERRAMEALRESERLLAQAEAIAHVGSWTWDMASGAATWSDELYRIYGYDPGKALPDPDLANSHIHPDDRPQLTEALGRTLEQGIPWRLEARVLAADGVTRVIESRGRARFGPDGQVVGAEGSAQDITDRVAAEATLRAVVDQPLAGFYVIQGDRFSYVNGALADVFGHSPEEILALHHFSALVVPRDRELVAEHVARRLAGTGDDGPYTFRGLRADGREVEVENFCAVTDVGGSRAVVGVLLDISERRRTERALLESEERFRLVARAANDVVYEWNAATGKVWWSEAMESVLGYPADAAVPDIGWWESRVHPEDRARVTEVVRRAISDRRPWATEYRFLRGDGSWATVLDRGFAVHDDVPPTRMIGSMVDISEREALAAQLRQAQKMDAVGRLAGGIAHDFNNVLTAILTTAELAYGELEPEHPVRGDLAEIRAAGMRAAALTRQLLAFSRRQMLQLEHLDLAEVVTGAGQLLRRVLGAQVQLEVVTPPEPAPVRADRSQLEQVLVNLVVNARDAMPHGGTITISVGRHVEAPLGPSAPVRRWVTLSVRDSGTGMDAATLARAFEPFFTTKPVGQGTGLGLATVYGITEQLGGSVRAESAPGAGTTVAVQLPEDDVAPSPAAPLAEPPDAGAAGNGTILLAEDEPAVRRSTRRMLEQEGYTVLEAENGEAALALLERHGASIDLVLSDVVMPRLGGRGLVERLRAQGSAVPVLFMSGYEERPDGGASLDGASVLAKPFGRRELLAAVRAAIHVAS